MVQNTTQEVKEEMKTLMEDVRALLSATEDSVEEEIVEARSRLRATLSKRNELYGNIRDKIVARAQDVDKVVREKPYHAAGIALGIGALLGLAFMIRSRRD